MKDTVPRIPPDIVYTLTKFFWIFICNPYGLAWDMDLRRRYESLNSLSPSMTFIGK